MMNEKHFMTRIDKIANFDCETQPRGFTLVELLIAMVVGLIILGATYAVFIAQNKELGKQEQIAVMQQNARMAMEMITREIMMAGYGANTVTRCSGTTTATITPCVGITAANADSISFSADLDDSGSPASGANENITYDVYASSGIQVMGRTSNGSKQPVVENIYPSATEPALSFTYLNADGSTTADLTLIRRIQIVLTARTANIDPDTGAYRYYTLKSNVTPRNLGMTGY